MFQTGHPISLARAEKNFNFQRSVCGGYYTALSHNIIHDVFVSFPFAWAKLEVIWFDTLVADQSLALLHVLHIN